MLTGILESGLPSDNGIRPHLSVILDTTNDTPAQLAGYGSIGPKLLDYLTCDADITPIHTRNLGRSEGEAEASAASSRPARAPASDEMSVRGNEHAPG